MKRILLLAAALLLSFSASAIGPWSPAKKIVEGYGHISVSEGTNYSGGAAFVWGKQHTKGFFLGAGAGLRFVHSVSETEDLGGGTRIRYYGGETVAPIFVRARFGRVRPGQFRPFVTADIGTVINFDPDGNTRGFFFDPQIGLDITDNVFVALGVDAHHFLSRSVVTFSDVVGAISNPEHKVREIMSSGITLHVGYSF
jgi:hypothetical protein